MSIYFYIGIGIIILLIIFAFGYTIGKTIASIKYSVKIDNYKAKLDYKEDRIFELNKKLKREMEKNRNAR